MVLLGEKRECYLFAPPKENGIVIRTTLVGRFCTNTVNHKEPQAATFPKKVIRVAPPYATCLRIERKKKPSLGWAG